ncbi:hypothetical protein D9619_007455 [Psilocybe cf. subviscida]|uniref:Uncharacterized protein n=1 Tax=Psilocybe cf. subviscida TaxID=2480587 RepID=A0A8H5EWS8_9AGAR|nr:hypothetical protein D9619_007455 [Psilocybe cf. subviscida]
MSSPTSSQEQVYQLSFFDEMFAEVGITMAWIVEGRIDVTRITGALDRITARWPMLASRIERGTDHRMQLRIRLPEDGKYPPDYKLYAATSTTNPNPLTNFVPLPLPVAHDMLPVSLMSAPDTPQTTRQWIEKSLPLIYWHVTHFAPEGNGAEYSTIGVTFPHAVFDGLGIARVIHTLEAELLGRDWEPPPLPVDEQNINALESLLTGVMEEQDKGLRPPAKETYAGSIVSLWFSIAFLSWTLWQALWHKTQCRTIIIPEKAYTRLRDNIRDKAALADKDQVPISTADVISALIFKTMFSDASPNALLQLSSLASVRRFSSPSTQNIASYPHNCVLSLPYPLFPAPTLAALPLSTLAAQLASHRHAFTLEDAADFYRLMQRAWHLGGSGRGRNVSPYDPRAHENLMLSNMTIARIVDIDWTGAGAGVGKTVCRYKAALTGLPLWFTNIATVAGKLPDGSLVLDLAFSKKRMDMFEARVRELIAEADEV